MMKKIRTVVPKTRECEFCDSIAWLAGYEAVKLGHGRSIIEKWRCFSDDTHNSNIFIITYDK